jgi:hypothetical protein
MRCKPLCAEQFEHGIDGGRVANTAAAPAERVDWAEKSLLLFNHPSTL